MDLSTQLAPKAKTMNHSWNILVPIYHQVRRDRSRPHRLEPALPRFFHQRLTQPLLKHLLLLLFSLALGGPAVATPPPNILFILADDLGWSDLASYGHPYHQTPHLDRLAGEGMRFTQAYAPAPICSASRAAILTGKTPARLHFEFVTKEKPGTQNLGQRLQPPPYPTNLALAETTLAEVLTQAGYHTAFFGKWHLNLHHEGYLGWSPTHGPLQQGFTEGDADFGAHPYSYFKGGDRSELPLKQGEFPSDSLTDKVIACLQRQHQHQPFFIQWSHYHVHDPVHTRSAWLRDKYRRLLPPDADEIIVDYAAMVETLDHEIGRVLSALDASGHAQDTLVVFMADNGGHPNYTGNAPHRGSKWNLYEGGIRVPFLVRWPTQIVPGTLCDQPVHGCDLLPTFAALAKTTPPAVDGVNLLPVFQNPTPPLPERTLLWHFPFYHPEKGFAKAPAKIGINDFVTSQTRPHSAIRRGPHKLLHFNEDDRVELYDLTTDPGETTNLAASQPDLAQRLRDHLQTELKAGQARFAKPTH
jgi:arylsulfatase A-like enzyme